MATPKTTSIKKMILYLTQESRDRPKSFSFVCQCQNHYGSFMFSGQRRIWSSYVVVLQRTAKKCTKNYNACAQPLFCSLNLCLPTFPLPLSPGQTIATCQRNISQHCWAQHVVFVWPPCCDVLRHVGCCWLKFENGQIWANNAQHVATCRNRVAKRTQHVAPNNVAIC